MTRSSKLLKRTRPLDARHQLLCVTGPAHRHNRLLVEALHRLALHRLLVVVDMVQVRCHHHRDEGTLTRHLKPMDLALAGVVPLLLVAEACLLHRCLAGGVCRHRDEACRMGRARRIKEVRGTANARHHSRFKVNLPRKAAGFKFLAHVGWHVLVRIGFLDHYRHFGAALLVDIFGCFALPTIHPRTLVEVSIAHDCLVAQSELV